MNNRKIKGALVAIAILGSASLYANCNAHKQDGMNIKHNTCKMHKNNTESTLTENEALKRAVAKLILKNKEMETEISSLKNTVQELMSLKEQIESLKANAKTNSFNPPVKSSTSLKIYSFNHENFEDEKSAKVKAAKEIVKKEDRLKSKSVQEKINKSKSYNKKRIEGSYRKLSSPKTYKVDTESISVYELPVINSKKVEGINFRRGEILESDKYTNFGWVHIKDKGWVKGYLLYPKYK